MEKNGRYERVDFSPEGWSGVPDGAIGVWRTEVAEPELKIASFLDLDQLLDLFMQLAEQANEHQQKLRYVLALLLIRKKRLILDETLVKPDGNFMVLVGSQGEGTFEITEEQLSQFEVAQMQAEIEALGREPNSQAA
ncbi:MAG: hypothetical protein JKY95_02490 [Planctomycetaceae bacterium]|nr:hypothetical protein [Planctomycetaceae bacterium]